MVKVLEKPKGWHRMWVPVTPAPEPPPAANCALPTLPNPLTWVEEVLATCYPYNVAADRAWEKCVKAAKVANGYNHDARAYIKIAVKQASLARQYPILARIAGTAPWDGIPVVATN